MCFGLDVGLIYWCEFILYLLFLFCCFVNLVGDLFGNMGFNVLRDVLEIGEIFMKII